jgi:hypothetical protein
MCHGATGPFPGQCEDRIMTLTNYELATTISDYLTGLAIVTDYMNKPVT